MFLARVVRKCDLVPALKALNRGLRRVSAYGHKVQFEAEWRILPAPEWYDHLIFQHWLWYHSRNPMSWERGIFGMLAMKHGCRVLDLCCGGGFFAHHFFSSRAGSVVSVDFDAKAIEHARANFRAPNVEYRCADIRTDMPAGEFDNVVWDAAIEHFTQEETSLILQNIKRRLTPMGTLSGYTIVERSTGKSLSHHEYEYKSKEELAGILKTHFINVLVFENISRDEFEERHNLYFLASDSMLPFDANWPNMVRL
jgi:2-polyprenyl-3-methyl-5-hydroxy-6-metoxy-1,4-benzoquinol methylase